LERVSMWENSPSWRLRSMIIVENSFCASTSNCNKMECYSRILSP
jgi:hypothetical protein